MTHTFSVRYDWVIKALIGAFLFSLSFLLPKTAFAFENPARYYDWNTYYEPQVLGVKAFAQEEATAPATPTAPTAPDYQDYKQFDGYVLGFTADLNPDNPFYFVKRLQENVALTFTTDPQAKEETRLELAGERLSEIEDMTEAGKGAIVASLTSAYNDTMKTIATNLTDLKEQGQDVTPLLVTTDVEAAKHMLVLEEVSLKVPPEAEKGLETALAASEHAVDTVADVAGRPAVPPDLVTRLEGLKAQGLLTEEEVANLIAADSRVQAREDFRKLANANVLPEADFKKLDESARSYFPQGFAQVLEYKKFQELKRLETNRPDEATLAKLQEFADTYNPGDPVPPDLRSWWIPMIRLEELQNTIRPDLISEDFFRYRPDDQQKYQELVERVKPRSEDVTYVNNILATNPSLLNDPAYARIKALADKFGAVETTSATVAPQAQSCSGESHWVLIPFMPNGGYCVPNIVYSPITSTTGTSETPCPPGYHRSGPGSACYPDNPYGPGTGPTTIAGLPAAGTCSSGSHWVPEPTNTRGGYCAPDYPTIGGGPYPGPIAAPSYCPNGQVFRDGKCETYNPPPAEGCPAGQYWTGQKCVEHKQCAAGQYQDANGDCKQSTFQSPIPPPPSSCTYPSSGCPSGQSWDYGSCSCKTTGSFTPPPPPSSYTPPPPSGSPSPNCGSGYYWNGSYCMPSSGGPPPPPPSSYSQDPATACAQTPNCSWTGSTCQCSSTPPPPPSSYTPPPPGGPPPPPPSSYTPPSSYAPPPPPSSYTPPPPPSSYTPPPPPSSYEPPPPPSSYTPPASYQ